MGITDMTIEQRKTIFMQWLATEGRCIDRYAITPNAYFLESIDYIGGKVVVSTGYYGKLNHANSGIRKIYDAPKKGHYIKVDGSRRYLIDFNSNTEAFA